MVTTHHVDPYSSDLVESPGIVSFDDNPVALKAETTSKPIFFNGYDELIVAHTSTVQPTVIIRKMIMIANAFIWYTPEISRLNTTTRPLPRIMLQTESTTTAKVVVFIPPPVEFGDAPISIRTVMMNKVEDCN